MQNKIVLASAGAGKTHYLTEHYLSLLLSAELEDGLTCASAIIRRNSQIRSSGILAVTFTKKAAAEMRERVLLKLKCLAQEINTTDEGGNTSTLAQNRLQEILRHSWLLNIRTIDSFLHLLIRLFALEFGFSPDFEIFFDQEAKEILEELFTRQAPSFASSTGEKPALLEEALRVLIAFRNPKGFWLLESIRKNIREIFQFRLKDPDLKLPTPEEAWKLFSATKTRIEETAAEIKSLASAEKVSLNAHFRNLLDKMSHSCLDDYLRGAPSKFANKDSVIDCVNKASQKKVEQHLEELYSALKLGLKILPSLRDWTYLAPMWKMTDLLMQELLIDQRRKGYMFSEQQPYFILQTLSGEDGVPDAYCRLGTTIKSLLIDEFQDTSRPQWAVMRHLALECLANGGNLCRVGDVKQAIYGWREGDASLFHEASTDEEICAIAPTKKVTLPFNWRSAPEVVSFNNIFFTKLKELAPQLSKDLLKDAPLQVSNNLEAAIKRDFAGCEQETPNQEKKSGFIQIKRVERKTEEQPAEAIIQAVSQILVKDILSRRSYGDVAILTRKNKEADQLASALIDLGLPVVTENSLRLAEHPIIDALVAFLRFIEYPPDDESFWRFITAAEIFGEPAEYLGGLSRENLVDWLVSSRSNSSAREISLYLTFKKEFPRLWAELIEPFASFRGPASPYDLVREVVTAYRLLERHPREETFIRSFLEFVHFSEGKFGYSLAAFLAAWDEKGLAEKVPQPEDANAIRVMTLHKAKGLEFPVVMVPIYGSGSSPQSPLTLLDESNLKLICRESSLPEPLKSGRKAKSIEDSLNLLYVAWTRPKEELHIILPQKESKKTYSATFKVIDSIFDALGYPEGDFDLGRRPDPETAASLQLPKFTNKKCELKLPLDIPMNWLRRLRVYRAPIQEIRAALLRAEEKWTLEGHLRGTILHDALAGLCGAKVNKVKPELILKAAFAKARMPLDDKCFEDCLSRLYFVLSLPEMQKILPEAISETEILLPNQELNEAEAQPEGKIKRPDLMAITTERIVIVEYKSGQESPAHNRQLKEYLDIAHKLPQSEGKSIQGLLVYLDLEKIILV